MFGKSNVFKNLSLSGNALAQIGHPVQVLLNPGDSMAGLDLSALIENRRTAFLVLAQNPGDPAARTEFSQINKSLFDFLSMVWSAGSPENHLNPETVAALPQVLGDAEFTKLAKETAKAIAGYYGSSEQP